LARLIFPQFKRGKQGIRVTDGSILGAARQLGIGITSECDGEGVCGKCVVRIEKGGEFLSPPSQEEKRFNLGRDERLACQAKVVGDGDVYIFVREAGKYSILSETVEGKVKLNPFIHRRKGRVWRDEEDLDKDKGRILGLAVDVGTTTLVIQIVNLESGEKIATFTGKNPQASYGDDIISRIGYTMRKKTGLRELQKIIIQAVNFLLGKFDKKEERASQQIYEVVVVGNSTMQSIFFGRDVSSLGVIPFEPVSKDSINRPASQMGLAVNPRANVYGAPLIGGHAGADALADIVVTEIYKEKRPSMIIDIGTNGEVVVGNREKMLTASCAAGGAYEGAAVGFGTGAIEGAIKNLKISNGQVSYETIGGGSAVGICGSGLIDLLAELLRNGIMSKQAKIKNSFVITDNISLSQEDIYQLITAKAGLRLDQDLLIKYYGISLDEIEKIYLSGAFGNFVNSENAITIGLLPQAGEKVVKIGNGALGGARQILLSRKKRKIAEDLSRTIEHIKPNEREADFAYLVAEKMYFE